MGGPWARWMLFTCLVLTMMLLAPVGALLLIDTGAAKIAVDNIGLKINQQHWHTTLLFTGQGLGQSFKKSGQYNGYKPCSLVEFHSKLKRCNVRPVFFFFFIFFLSIAAFVIEDRRTARHTGLNPFYLSVIILYRGILSALIVFFNNTRDLQLYVSFEEWSVFLKDAIVSRPGLEPTLCWSDTAELEFGTFKLSASTLLQIQ